MKHKILWHQKAWDDYLFWQETDKKLFQKINILIKDTDRHPAEGLGKPERLKYLSTHLWSRRINLEHRLVYTFNDDIITILSCRYHYQDLNN